MNKLALAVMISTLGMAAGTAQARPSMEPIDPTGMVHFHGKVLTNSCKITGEGKNLNVTLPVVMDRQVHAGQTTGDTRFEINVKDCPAYGHYAPKLAWDVPRVDVNKNGDLTNDGRGGAQNVALRLIDNHNNNVNLKDSTKRYKASYVSHDGERRTYSFKVGYIKGDERGPVKPGSVKAHAKYSITYQ